MDPKLEKELASHRRKKQLAALSTDLVGNTPVSYLLSVMSDTESEKRERMDAAKALLPYFHSKKPNETIVEVREPITAIVRKVI